MNMFARQWRLCLWILPMVGLATSAAAVPVFDTAAPASFFTNVANQVLLAETAGWQAQNFAAFTNTFGATVTNGFGLTNIPVLVNGNFVYSASIQRLLQVTANIFDATSTNPYPSVFRPMFTNYNGNIFIVGYEYIPYVSGVNDQVLAQPVGATALTTNPALDTYDINVYGVPWIIGAKKGLPNFNELYTLNTIQVTRKLLVNRTTANVFDFTIKYTTNELYIMSMTNSFGMSFWNSYDTNYVGSSNISIFMQDYMTMGLTNAVYNTNTGAFFTFYTNFTSPWPGSAWTYAFIQTPPPVPSSFISTNGALILLPGDDYRFSTASFVPDTLPTQFETNVVNNPPLPQFGLATTNWLQAFILDGQGSFQHVIDYVQFSGPNSIRNLNAELADPNDTGSSHYMWSTNAYGKGNISASPSYGEVNQIFASLGVFTPPPLGGVWSIAPIAPGINSVTAQQNFFRGFWTPTWQYNGVTYTNTALSVIAPYTPVRTMYDYALWQANDPLVHYLANDLNYNVPGTTGIQRSDLVPPVFRVPGINLSQAGSHYQPWGTVGQMAGLVGVDTNASNLAFKDPLVWGSDYWNFPTNQTWNPNWLGQVHRGTPWQTLYLKATNILSQNSSIGNQGYKNVGTNTWDVWTGVTNLLEAQRTSPTNDWHLASLLTALLNTNTSPAFFSVNNSDTNAWATRFDGLTALTNILPGTTIILSSNSPAVAAIVTAIQSTRTSQPGQLFLDAGDVFATPQLSTQSPFLNWSDPVQQKTGISDAAYEDIPSQLLSQLVLAPIGTLSAGSGQLLVQFAGGAGHVYVLQCSPDLVHWTNLTTNSPVNGQVNFTIPSPQTSVRQFYRSILVQ